MRCEEHLRCTLKCAFDISCFEMDVYAELLKRGKASVDEIAEVLERDKSTVYKALQNLLEKGLVTREYKILRGGGYKYLYKPVSVEDLKREMSRAISRWVKELMDFLDSLEEMDREKLVQSFVEKR